MFDRKTVETHVPKIDPSVVSGFSIHDTAKISDAMAKYGTLRGVYPLSRGMHVCGRAVTVACEPGDKESIFEAVETAEPGDILVIAAGGKTGLASIDRGILSAVRAKQLTGIVLDGQVRDRNAWIEDCFPVFCRGTALEYVKTHGPCRINGEISCAGLLIHAGDLVVGDDDGVAVVPGTDLTRVLSMTDAHLSTENSWQPKFDAGVTMTELFGCEPKIDKWREK
ncbi:MAG: hypothetical protein Q4B07_00410 [Clostridia bacterium]|nr:hypothetical protein [Clostridia bacterium]